ncbi:tryptophan-rich antigen [Plasmodium cynomolgi strain B]|uniref:Tryptophan-rich antigen n=1 Tax=Plasmodium cynomolgi (strain B) TaxID=1120755 RepID=K6UZM8_PLACD|nr:tryptophan-rich antigen [Plasmodium cynomolgi strain B]GAB69449.1 tryptophan-rich antigen [Plasmodium cynomolgi strain B]
MEKKWEHYDEYTFKELLSNKAKDALTWNDKEWTNWVSKNGRLALKGDWNKWVNGQDVFFKSGINNDWKNWSEFKRKEYGLIEWKYFEDKFWKYWMNNSKVNGIDEKMARKT